MTEESILRDLGVHKEKQWYQLYPARLAEEIELMRSRFPLFTASIQEGKNISWTGKAITLKEDDTELASLNIKIECKREYPIVFPVVYDLEGVLARRKCPHVSKFEKDCSQICYGNRLDPQLDFLGSARIINVVEYICIFLARQWHFERYNTWPDSQLHEERPFLRRELDNGPIDLGKLCRCGLTSKSYRNCCMPKVDRRLYEKDRILPMKFKGMVNEIGRNANCPCGHKLKAKKCCFGELNFRHSKIFLLLKYPGKFGVEGELKEELLDLLWS